MNPIINQKRSVWKFKPPPKAKPSQHSAYALVLDTQGLKRVNMGSKSYGGTVWKQTIIHQIRQPVETYELLGKNLIRTINVLHYISQHTVVNGICNSFGDIQRKFIRLQPLHGKEEVQGIHDIVWEAFRARYFVGRIRVKEIFESDLSIPLRYVIVKINKENYFIVQLKSAIHEGFSEWRMFKTVTYPKPIFTLNPTIPLTRTQEEIIEDIKSGKITKITEYGNPRKKYTPKEVLLLLNQLN